MFSEGIRACGEAIINHSSDQTTDRAQFAKRVAEFLSWLKAKGTVKPESVPGEDWQAYANMPEPSSTKESLSRSPEVMGQSRALTRTDHAAQARSSHPVWTCRVSLHEPNDFLKLRDIRPGLDSYETRSVFSRRKSAGHRYDQHLLEPGHLRRPPAHANADRVDLLLSGCRTPPAEECAPARILRSRKLGSP